MIAGIESIVKVGEVVASVVVKLFDEYAKTNGHKPQEKSKNAK